MTEIGVFNPTLNGENRPTLTEIHRYYQTRDKNPLKKMQSVVVIACKVLRVFYAILTKGVEYDGEKMLRDIRRPGMSAQAA